MVECESDGECSIGLTVNDDNAVAVGLRSQTHLLSKCITHPLELLLQYAPRSQFAVNSTCILGDTATLRT